MILQLFLDDEAKAIVLWVSESTAYRFTLEYLSYTPFRGAFKCPAPYRFNFTCG